MVALATACSRRLIAAAGSPFGAPKRQAPSLATRHQPRWIHLARGRPWLLSVVTCAPAALAAARELRAAAFRTDRRDKASVRRTPTGLRAASCLGVGRRRVLHVPSEACNTNDNAMSSPAPTNLTLTDPGEPEPAITGYGHVRQRRTGAKRSLTTVEFTMAEREVLDRLAAATAEAAPRCCETRCARTRPSRARKSTRRRAPRRNRSLEREGPGGNRAPQPVPSADSASRAP